MHAPQPTGNQALTGCVEVCEGRTETEPQAAATDGGTAVSSTALSEDTVLEHASPERAVSKRGRRIAGRAGVAVAATVALALAFAGCGGDDSDDNGASGAEASAAALPAATPGVETVPAITVRGEGRVQGRPDLMTVSMGVEVNADTADEALSEANVLATALIETFKSEGVAERDLQTSDLSIWPNWDRDSERIVGYHVSNALTVKLRDLDKAGQVIDTAAGAVGDAVRFHGISFSIEDTTDLLAVARTDAVERAADQARQLADAAGVELGDLRAIDETGGSAPPPTYYSATDSVARMADSVPIEAGTQEVTLEVVLVYDIAR